MFVVLATAMVGCGGAQAKKAPSARGPVIVSVAASTKDAITPIAKQFQEQTGLEIRINTGPSNALANQIVAGAPADLFLSANRKWADEVQKAGQTVDSMPLLTNKLVLIVPKGNPAKVSEPGDLLKPEVKHVALAGENVPAGTYAQQALTRLKVYDELAKAGKIARGQDVRATLSYVDRGEAEAGIVYSTDLGAAKNVETVHEFDPQTHDEIVYVLVLLKHSEGNAAAKAFYDYLASQEAGDVFRQFGFQPARP